MNGSVALTLVAQIAIAQLASFASLLLVASGVHKFAGRVRAQRAVHELTGLPWTLAGIVAIGIAAAELTAGIGLWIPAARFNAALLAALVWGSYFAYLLRAVIAGHSDVDCGCGFSSAHRPLGAFELVRAAILTSLGLMVAVSAAAAPGAVAYDISVAAILTELLAGGALLALYAALDEVMSIQPLRAGVHS